MKKMKFNLIVKLIYTTIFIAQGVFQLINFFPTFNLSLRIWNVLNTTISLLLLIAFITLLVRIWKFKKTPRETKIMWTVLIMLFTPIFGIIYIWKIDPQLFLNNKK